MKDVLLDISALINAVKEVYRVPTVKVRAQLGNENAIQVSTDVFNFSVNYPNKLTVDSQLGNYSRTYHLPLVDNGEESYRIVDFKTTLEAMIDET